MTIHPFRNTHSFELDQPTRAVSIDLNRPEVLTSQLDETAAFIGGLYATSFLERANDKHPRYSALFEIDPTNEERSKFYDLAEDVFLSTLASNGGTIVDSLKNHKPSVTASNCEDLALQLSSGNVEEYEIGRLAKARVLGRITARVVKCQPSETNTDHGPQIQEPSNQSASEFAVSHLYWVEPPKSRWRRLLEWHSSAST